MNWRIFFILILGINGCEYLDEEPPEIIEGLACYFSMKNNTPAVRLSWIPTEDDDVTEYQIFKSSDSTTFDLLTTLSSKYSTFSDTLISWEKGYSYQIRAVDKMKNLGDNSDTVSVLCYSGCGLWSFSEFDSLKLCIENNYYATEPSFSVVLSDSFISLNDTVGTMHFSEAILDSNTWIGSGWMNYVYQTLELNSLTGEYDTVTTNGLPEYYTIELSEPDSGEIYFVSGKYNTFNLSHTVKDCDGTSYFPE